jgi:hypothetical protein
MARHNREASGSDQHGFDYVISYQPDWLQHVKVTRTLDTGRQSTKTLFANPERPVRPPGQQVRTAIRCSAQGLEFEIAITDPGRAVRRVIIETGPDPRAVASRNDSPVQFTIERRV